MGAGDGGPKRPLPPPAPKGTFGHEVLAPRVVRYTRDEVRQHEEAVEAMLVQAASKAQVVKELRRLYNCGRQHSEKVYYRVRDRWEDETEKTRPTTRAVQIQRLHRYIQRLQGKIQPDGSFDPPPNYPMLLRAESLLADLEGNREPVHVSVDVRYTEAMMAVMANTSGEELIALAREQLLIERKAAAFDAAGEAAE